MLLSSLRRRRAHEPPPTRLLRLPPRGRLLVCTDLHGNLADFRRMREVFLQALRAGEDPFLLFTGDLVHGPDCDPADWPTFLGEHYRDESGQLCDEYIALRDEHAGRVACLLGNHEHSHVGGPHTPKFWPDETAHFEETVGAKRAERYRALFRGFALVAVSSCGVAVTHAAPNAEIAGPDEIEALKLDGYEQADIWEMAEAQVLGALLWARACAPEVARRFLDALGRGGPQLALVVYGHEIVAEGYEPVGDEQLVLSTSFGVARASKRYLKLDLAGRYSSARELRDGVELVPLYGAEP
jgi:hypothetical protein